MNKTFAVLGAGMQGTAAAYDIAKFASPARILMGDLSFEHAKANSWRVNDLVGSAICEPVQVNALDPNNLCKFLEGVDVLLSCVPYWMHPKIARVAIDCGTSMVDLGGNTEVTLQTLKMNEEAREAGVTLVPDTGLAPGLVNNLGIYFLENMDSVDNIRLYCGVLPQNPKPPFNYMLTFNIEGLVAEYEDQAVTLTDGEIRLVNTLEELEEIEVEQLGKMEAFTTSGGTSTAPYTFQGQVRNYAYKTIRFPGHCEKMKIFKDCGFWSLEETEVTGKHVKPRDLWHKLMGECLSTFKDLDMAVVRGIGVGKAGGKNAQWQIDIFDRQDEVTGFTSMERLTGFTCAIYAIEIAEGLTEKGCLRYENAMKGTKVLEELQKRGVGIKFQKA
jgi:lysine 6-dehydrogenase